MNTIMTLKEFEESLRKIVKTLAAENFVTEQEFQRMMASEWNRSIGLGPTDLGD